MSDEDSWVPLSMRREWADVEPIPQDDGPNPVVPIAYTSQFREVMDYFRAMVHRDERSHRALALTAEVIELNPGNYTVWHFRRLVLEALEVDLSTELLFVDNMVLENPKNYQIWHHRRWIAQKRGLVGKDHELKLTKTVLKEDAKNYHAWSHRQWVLKEQGGLETELAFCDKLLQKDVYNNSAWNQRFYVITHTCGLAAARASEVKYSCNAIRLAPGNESPWRYLAGLFKDDKSALPGCGEAVGICIELLAKDKMCVHALSFLLELLCRGYRPTVDNCRLLGFADGLEPEEVASQVCERLELADAIRLNYWTWRKSLLKRV